MVHPFPADNPKLSFIKLYLAVLCAAFPSSFILCHFMCMMLFAYMYVCVCVCVCSRRKREREKKRKRKEMKEKADDNLSKSGVKWWSSAAHFCQTLGILPVDNFLLQWLAFSCVRRMNGLGVGDGIVWEQVEAGFSSLFNYNRLLGHVFYIAQDLISKNGFLKFSIWKL